ncbi:uncharacterized protein LOC110179864 [Drosophila serrata]|uniref:uncharacterized protein LOC110179864 n=1 Tax=Drosophila serrata TaxID=7274 RepID=UPI000A1CF870|nr:uncharacterized protein LOC110179864 [Drosophila serrata]
MSSPAPKKFSMDNVMSRQKKDAKEMREDVEVIKTSLAAMTDAIGSLTAFVKVVFTEKAQDKSSLEVSFPLKTEEDLQKTDSLINEESLPKLTKTMVDILRKGKVNKTIKDILGEGIYLEYNIDDAMYVKPIYVKPIYVKPMYVKPIYVKPMLRDVKIM